MAVTVMGKELAAKTCSAYSFDRYRSWPAVCSALLAKGYSMKQAEAILRSKWTRWAADASGKSHGKATGEDLLRWMVRTFKNDNLLWQEVEKLTRETFPE